MSRILGSGVQRGVEDGGDLLGSDLFLAARSRRIL
jgi:hypothetical protein